MLFDKLPEVTECCFCIPLQYGSIFIALYTIILNFVVLFHDAVLVCSVGIKSAKCEFKPHIKYIHYVNTVITFLYIGPSILLIVGVFLRKRSLITCFLYCYVIATVGEVASDICVVGVSAYSPHCDLERIAFITCLLTCVLNLCLSIYFIIVVTSFRTAISDRHSLSSNPPDSKSSIILVDGRRVSVRRKNLAIRDTRPVSPDK